MFRHAVRATRRFLGIDPDRDRSADLMELMSVIGEAHAHVIRGSLEAHGVPAMIRRRTPISTYTWQMTMSSTYEIWVRRGDLERAASLVEAV